jgi:hypothetical protein
MNLALYLMLCAAAMPHIASALTLRGAYDSFSPLLYGAIGFFGAAAVLLFGAGFILYIVRMGTDHRVEGIDYMIQATYILFVVLILVAIVALIE